MWMCPTKKLKKKKKKNKNLRPFGSISVILSWSVISRVPMFVLRTLSIYRLCHCLRNWFGKKQLSKMKDGPKLYQMRCHKYDEAFLSYYCSPINLVDSDSCKYVNCYRMRVLFLPVSQCVPTNPGGQSHVYPVSVWVSFTVSTQPPPFWHGLESHWSITVMGKKSIQLLC